MKRTLTHHVDRRRGASLLQPDALFAIPAFARKYGFNCNMCHVAYPKLNDFGQRFRDSGYQIPGQAGLEKTVFETGHPIGPADLGRAYACTATARSTTRRLPSLRPGPAGGGVLHKNISFLFVYTPRIDEPAADLPGPGYGQQSVPTGGHRVGQRGLQQPGPGQAQPAHRPLRAGLPAAQLQAPLLSSGSRLTIYGFAGSRNPFDFSANQIGIEATGRFQARPQVRPGRASTAAAVTPTTTRSRTLYLRSVQDLRQGRGPVGRAAGRRLRLSRLAADGLQRQHRVARWAIPTAKRTEASPASGGDLSLNWKTLNLQAMAFTGRGRQGLQRPRADRELLVLGRSRPARLGRPGQQPPGGLADVQLGAVRPTDDTAPTR